MNKNEIWNNENLTKRQKVTLSYNTPAPLRNAQLNYWTLEAEGKTQEADAAYESSVQAWEAAGTPNNEDHAQF